MRWPLRNPDGGFTLLEALLAAVILAMAITAITMPFTAGAQSQLEDARRTLAVNLAQEMMEEILAKPFADPQGASAPGPETGELSRALFDNIDDYHGYEEPAGAVADPYGQVINDPEAVWLSRHVTATYVYVSGQDVSAEPTFLRVQVEVRYKAQPVVNLTRLVYRLRY